MKPTLSLTWALTAFAALCSTPYHSNHAFRFTNSARQSTWARLLVEPSAGAAYLTADLEAMRAVCVLPGASSQMRNSPS